jgi:DNA-binding FadR family transcriptional regulator
VSEAIARELLEYILHEQLEPGTKLPPESAMLAAYDVGRGSLREALRILEVYGILSIRPGPGGGPVVEAVGPRELARLMMFYLNVKGVTFSDLGSASRLLQVAMASEAARRRNPKQIKRMRVALEKAAKTDDDLEYGNAIHAFHNALFDAPGGELLGLLYDAMHQIVILRLRRRISLDQAREGLADHQAILDAIAEGDVEKAGRLTAEHVEQVDELYEKSTPGLLAETIAWA